MKRPFALAVTILVIVMLASGCASTLTDAATVTFKLGKSQHELHVRRDDLLGEVRTLLANKQFATLLQQNGFTVNGPASAGSKVTATWLTLLIDQGAIDALYSDRHLHITSAVRTQATKDVPGLFNGQPVFDAFSAKFKATMIERQARREELLASYVNTSDAAGEAYFNAHKSQFACASGKSVAHILVASKATAQAILDQLHAGASFATLAQKDSTDSSAKQGGSLGCLNPKEFVAPFQAAADSAPFDTPVGPVQSQFGWHVILVTRTTPSYASVRTQVQQALTQQGQTAAQTALAALLKAFHVHMDARFGTWGGVKDNQGGVSYQVTPPAAPSPNTSREGSTTTTAASLVPGASTGSP